jgi:CelD/BcsL family acetyltransferase involved in cellulose biosynthesis
MNRRRQHRTAMSEGARTDVAELTTSAVGADGRADAEAIWRALEAEYGRPPLSCSWDWTQTWLEVYGADVPHRFVIGERDGRPRAIALLTLDAPSRPSLRPRTLHVGTAGEPRGDTVAVERNGLLVAPEDKVAFSRGLVAFALRSRGWQRLSLDGFAPDEAAGLLAAEPRFLVRIEESPVADLRAGRDGDVLSALSSSRRQRIRRAVRRFGELEAEWAADEVQASDVLNDLIALHQARWRAVGETGSFASRRFTMFHQAMIRRLLPRNEVILFRVRRGDETVGCVYCLVEGRRALFYLSGLRRYPDNRMNAAAVVHALCMQACRDRGLAEYDFLAPGDRYKHELSTRTDSLIWAEFYRRRPTTQAWRALKVARAAMRSRRG